MSLKVGLMTGGFSCMGLGDNSWGLGIVPREKTDVQGYGPRLCLVTVQVIQLIMGWEVTKPICSAVTRHTCAHFSSTGVLLAL